MILDEFMIAAGLVPQSLFLVFIFSLLLLERGLGGWVCCIIEKETRRGHGRVLIHEVMNYCCVYAPLKLACV
jgi:hypothetical protein